MWTFENMYYEPLWFETRFCKIVIFFVNEQHTAFNVLSVIEWHTVTLNDVCLHTWDTWVPLLSLWQFDRLKFIELWIYVRHRGDIVWQILGVVFYYNDCVCVFTGCLLWFFTVTGTITTRFSFNLLLPRQNCCVLKVYSFCRQKNFMPKLILRESRKHKHHFISNIEILHKILYSIEFQ